jgi:uncharacterized membrane protein YedE/YeeE
MRLLISIFLAGLLFGTGLAVSDMVNPARVVGFLDIAGEWDATLILVMGAALAVTLPGFTILIQNPKPYFTDRFHLPTKQDLDMPLITGAVIFGIGWGLAGFCPGPALASLVTLDGEVVLFVCAMLAGQVLAMQFEK